MNNFWQICDSLILPYPDPRPWSEDKDLRSYLQSWHMNKGPILQGVLFYFFFTQYFVAGDTPKPEDMFNNDNLKIQIYVHCPQAPTAVWVVWIPKENNLIKNYIPT